MEKFYEIDRIELALKLAETWEDLPYNEGLYEVARELKSTAPCYVWEVLACGIKSAIGEKTDMSLVLDYKDGAYTIELDRMGKIRFEEPPLFREVISIRKKSPLLREGSKQYSERPEIEFVAEKDLKKKAYDICVSAFGVYDPSVDPDDISVDKMIEILQEAQRPHNPVAVKLVARFYELGLKLGTKWATEMRADQELQRLYQTDEDSERQWMRQGL